MNNDIDKIYNYTFRQIVDWNKNPEKVKQKLLSKGLSVKEADVIIEHILQQRNEIEKDKVAQRETKKEKANRDMLFGLLWLVGGIIVTYVSYLISFGGYIITWGAILFGAIQFLKGLFNRIILQLTKQHLR